VYTTGAGGWAASWTSTPPIGVFLCDYISDGIASLLPPVLYVIMVAQIKIKVLLLKPTFIIPFIFNFQQSSIVQPLHGTVASATVVARERSLALQVKFQFFTILTSHYFYSTVGTSLH
jgi:hypothetical protein